MKDNNEAQLCGNEVKIFLDSEQVKFCANQNLFLNK